MSTALTDKTYALFSSSANKKLAIELEKCGAKVFRFPPVETEKLILNKTKVGYLFDIAVFDWIIFTDVFAVDFFLQTMAENEIDFFEMDAVNVCAFGEAVSDRLRFVQLHADIIPNSIDEESVFSTLLTYASDEINDLKILIVKEISQNFRVTEKLIERGAKVIELPIYRATFADKNEIAKLKTLLTGGAIDEFVFSTPADFIALQFYFPGLTITDVLLEINVSATSENTFQTAKECNLRPIYFHL